MRYKHALVTGGAGFIGSHVVELLMEKGLSVTVLDNLSLGKKENVPEGAVFINGDINDFPLVQSLTGKCDIIFHHAARVSIRSSLSHCYEDAQVNLMGTLNLLKACHASHVKKFVFASSMAVYADSPKITPLDEEYRKEPISPYGISKLAAEMYIHQQCKLNNIDSVVLRYFNTFGPRQTLTPYVGVITIFINKLLKNEKPVILGDGEQIRDFVYVRDIARANILAMEYSVNQATLNIGTGIPTRINQLAELLCHKINPSLGYEYAKEHPGELRISYPDICRAGKCIGYQPKYTLNDKIDEVIDWIRLERKGNGMLLK